MSDKAKNKVLLAIMKLVSIPSEEENYVFLSVNCVSHSSLTLKQQNQSTDFSASTRKFLLRFSV